MSSAPTLGPITFRGFEVPERITFGGKQKLVVHALPGGRRVVDVMGQDDAPIRWEGVFSGSTASDRVRALERLRRDGMPQLLTWDGWRFRVIIASFEVNVTNTYWAPYSIELCVLSSLVDVAADWLISAATPAIPVASLGSAVIEQTITSAGAALAGSDLGMVVAASATLAQSVVRRALAGRPQ